MFKVFSLGLLHADGKHLALCPGADLTVSSEDYVVLSRQGCSSTPVFYFRDADELITSTSVLDLIRNLERRAAKLDYDVAYMSGYLAFQVPFTHRTLFREINVLRCGEYCHIDSKGGNWRNLPFSASETARPIAPSELTTRLEQIIKKLNPDKTVFHISSGLDSSIIAIKAAQIFGGRRVRLATCRTHGEGCSDELENVKRLAKDIDAELCIYDLTDTDVFETGREMVSNCLGYPVAHPSHLVEFLLDGHIAATGARTIVTGKGPDDCLAGYPWHRSEYSSSRAHRNRLMVTSQKDICRVIKEADCDEMLTFWREREDDLTLNERLWYDGCTLTEAWNIIHSAVAQYRGVEIVSPFMDPELRQGMFALPECMKLNGDRQKIFLRETFASDYPGYLLELPKRGLKLDLKPYFCEYDEDELCRIITGSSEMSERFFKEEGIRTMISATCRGEKNYGWQLWSMYLLAMAALGDGRRVV